MVACWPAWTRLGIGLDARVRLKGAVEASEARGDGTPTAAASYLVGRRRCGCVEQVAGSPDTAGRIRFGLGCFSASAATAFAKVKASLPFPQKCIQQTIRQS